MFTRIRISIPALLIAGLLGASSPCWAREWVANLTPSQVIAALDRLGEDELQIITSEAIANPAHCSNPDSYVMNSDLQAAALAIALAAYQSSKHIRLLLSETECDFATGRPVFTAIGIM